MSNKYVLIIIFLFTVTFFNACKTTTEHKSVEQSVQAEPKKTCVDDFPVIEKWILIVDEKIMSKYGPFPRSGYVNEKGEIMIPMDTYRCMSDTFEYYGLVEEIQGDGKFYGIDKSGNKLFQAVPDGEGYAVEEQEGRIMIQKNGKYGFANHKGEIVIDPEYDCVRSLGFVDGVALVSKKCRRTNDEKSWFKSDEWIVIDKCGNKIDTIKEPY